MAGKYLTGGSIPLAHESTDKVGGFGLNAYLNDLADHLVDFDNPHEVRMAQLSDVDMTNLVTDGVLTWNGANWIVRLPTAVAAAGTNRWWFTSENSDKAGSLVLNPLPDQGVGQEKSVQVTSTTPVNIGSWVTRLNYPNRTVIDQGTWDATVFVANDAIITLNQKIVVVSADGNTNVVQDEDLQIAPTYAPGETPVFGRERLTSAQVSQVMISATDRIEVIYSAYSATTPSTPINVAFSFAGTSLASSIVVPFVVQHNELAGLQGGDGINYFHLTQAQYEEFLGEFAINNLRYLGISTDVWNFNGIVIDNANSSVTVDASGMFKNKAFWLNLNKDMTINFTNPPAGKIWNIVVTNVGAGFTPTFTFEGLTYIDCVNTWDLNTANGVVSVFVFQRLGSVVYRTIAAAKVN